MVLKICSHICTHGPVMAALTSADLIRAGISTQEPYLQMCIELQAWLGIQPIAENRSRARLTQSRTWTDEDTHSHI